MGFVTIKDISQIAGVSQATVSRVLNNPSIVDPITRAKVERVIDEFHYAPSAAARNLSKSSSTTIGAIVADISNPFLSQLLKGVLKVCDREGYMLICMDNSDNSQQICEEMQKGALNLAEIQHQHGHGNHMGSSLLQFCGHQSHAAFALRQAESALHLHTLTLIPVIYRLYSYNDSCFTKPCLFRPWPHQIRAYNLLMGGNVRNNPGFMPNTSPEREQIKNYRC